MITDSILFDRILNRNIYKKISIKNIMGQDFKTDGGEDRPHAVDYHNLRKSSDGVTIWMSPLTYEELLRKQIWYNILFRLRLFTHFVMLSECTAITFIYSCGYLLTIRNYYSN
jgi:hypothetical protein